MSKADVTKSLQSPNHPLQGRRGFLKKSILASIAATLGAEIVHASKIPEGYIPLGVSMQSNPMEGKNEEMVIRNELPWNVEAKPHLLDDSITPFDKIFIRNNGIMPEEVDAANWTLTIGGESVEQEKTYTIADLKKNFKSYTYQLVLECGGNGRAGFYPPASGNQWEEGAVYCSEWTGVRLKDILQDVGIKSDAIYIGYYGADKHLNGKPDEVVISRGVPLAKALQDETLIAWSLNGKDIPLPHGYPLRLVCGGWPASTSGKWLHKFIGLQYYYAAISRDIEHELVPMAQDHNLAIFPWSPLAGGFLTGKFTREGADSEARRANFDFPPIDKEKAYDLVDVMGGIAQAHDASIAQVALAWVRQQPGITSTIIGAKTLDQLHANIASTEVQLTEADLDNIDKVSPLPKQYPGWMVERQSAYRK